jgi:Ca-activated chloride channel family protein
MVLLSDGENNVAHPESHWTPRQAAQIAASLSIPIYTIDAGSAPAEGGPREGPAPASSPVVREAAVQTLQDLARISGGRYFRARDTAGLLEACRGIDRLERSAIPSYQYRRYHEGYPWLALSAFVLFTLALALELTVWRRLP